MITSVGIREYQANNADFQYCLFSLEEFHEIGVRKFLTRQAISSKCFCDTTQQSPFSI
jgi:hypothetical protein